MYHFFYIVDLFVVVELPYEYFLLRKEFDFQEANFVLTVEFALQCFEALASQELADVWQTFLAFVGSLKAEASRAVALLNFWDK